MALLVWGVSDAFVLQCVEPWPEWSTLLRVLIALVVVSDEVFGFLKKDPSCPFCLEHTLCSILWAKWIWPSLAGFQLTLEKQQKVFSWAGGSEKGAWRADKTSKVGAFIHGRWVLVSFWKEYWSLSFFLFVAGVLFFVSATINPILYNLMSKKYQQAFKDTTPCSSGSDDRRLRDDRGRIFSEKYSNSTHYSGNHRAEGRGSVGNRQQLHGSKDPSPVNPNYSPCPGHYSSSTRGSTNSSTTTRDTSIGTRIIDCINGSAPYSKGRQSSDCIEMSNQGKPNIPEHDIITGNHLKSHLGTFLWFNCQIIVPYHVIFIKCWSH